MAARRRSAAGPASSTLFEELVGPFPYEKLAHLQSRHAVRRNGERERDLLRRHALSRAHADERRPHRARDGASVVRRRGHGARVGDISGCPRASRRISPRSGRSTSRGDTAFTREMAAIRAADPRRLRSCASRPVIDTAQTNYLALLNANSYQKGGYVLYMLHRQLGDSAFFGGLRVVLRRRIATAMRSPTTSVASSSSRPGDRSGSSSTSGSGGRVLPSRPSGGRTMRAPARYPLLVLQDSRAAPTRCRSRWSVTGSPMGDEAPCRSWRSRPNHGRRCRCRDDLPNGRVSIVFDPDLFLLARISQAMTIATSHDSRSLPPRLRWCSARCRWAPLHAQRAHAADAPAPTCCSTPGCWPQAEEAYYAQSSARPRDPVARAALGRYLAMKGAVLSGHDPDRGGTRVRARLRPGVGGCCGRGTPCSAGARWPLRSPIR